MPRVSVIIPVLNLWEMTTACLRSLAKYSADVLNCADQGLEVLVVDNGSNDATSEELPAFGQNLFGKNFKLLRLSQNMGFAIACNMGARAATGDLLFFLNNDTQVSQGWLPPLVDALESENIGATGPLLLYPNGKIQHCGIAISPFHRLWHIYEHFPGAHAVPCKKRQLQAITGAALILRRQYFFEAGAFFEGYLNGFEDLDLCCALRHKGYDLTLTPRSVVVHHTSQTPGRFDADTSNAALFTQRRMNEFKPDLHLLAARDGYRLRLGPQLTCWLTLPDSREDALNAEFEMYQKKSPAFIEKFLEQSLAAEPLWLGGHLQYMDTLEAAGRKHEAITAALAALDFFPLPQIQMRLARLARQQGMREELLPVLDRLTKEINPKPENFRAIALKARRKAIDRGDTALTKIMEEWLACYGTASAEYI